MWVTDFCADLFKGMFGYEWIVEIFSLKLPWDHPIRTTVNLSGI